MRKSITKGMAWGLFFGELDRKRPAHNRKTWKVILGKENVT